MGNDEKATDFKVSQLNISPTVPLPAMQLGLVPDARVDFRLHYKNREVIFNSHTIQTSIDGYHGYVQI